MNKYLIVVCISLFFSTQIFAATGAQEYKIPSQTQMLQLSLAPAEASSLELRLAVDTSTNPIQLKAKYQKLNDEGNVQQSCQFSGTLSADETSSLKKQLSALRYCKSAGNEDMVLDPEYLESLWVYTQKPGKGRSGLGAEIQKYSLAGWGPQKYLCKGGKDFYRLMKSISDKRALKNCPRQASRLFDYRPENY